MFTPFVENAEIFLANRFKSFDEEPLCLFKIFDTHKWPLDNLSLQAMGNRELKKLLSFYHLKNIISENEKECAYREWSLLKIEIKQRKKMSKYKPSPYDLYRDVLKTLELMEELPNILVLVRLMMIISVSTASCERGFSQMKNEKSSLRTRLDPNTLDDVLRINIDGKPVENVNLKPGYELWINDGPKHVNGHKLIKMITGNRKCC